ncbi:MAG: acyltransferase family protein [Flavobacteriaceae bacterium]
MSRNGTGRVDWVDYAKGFCIIFVVMMHSTLGVEAAAGAEGWMHWLVAFAKPFRMPDFFMISGLFLATRIDKPWRSYLDTKVVHFFYFYFLWVALQFAFKAPSLVDSWSELPGALLMTAVQPFGTLWFIYLLPVFFVFTKLTRGAHPAAIWLIGASLEMMPIHTGWVLADEFASRFVYFYSGYILAPWIFRLAAAAQRHALPALAGLLAWGLANGWAVFAGFSEAPGVSLLLGLAGAVAVVTVSALLALVPFASFLRYLGQNSIVVYLAFFLPMAVTRIALLKSGFISDLGTVSVLVTAAGVAAPVLLHLLVRDTRLKFLFERPAWARLSPASPRPAAGLQPAA